MAKNYWLHRISHEGDASYPLLEDGLLSIGWGDLMNIENLSGQTSEEFRKATDAAGYGSRSRWSLWKFLHFQVGDWVVVPLYDKNFSIVEVTGQPVPANHCAGKTAGSVTIREDGVYCGERKCDIGFLVPVKPVKLNISRSYAETDLVSRMKLRQTTADISDLASSVEEARKAEGPVTLHDPLIEAVTEKAREIIDRRITPDNLERLLCWYMKAKGASRVFIPAKNESGKANGADADVIAEFDDLGIIFYIQAKKHATDSETNSWAVTQIAEYKKQKEDEESGYTFIPWVVTTGKFSEVTRALAQKENVRLIDGDGFIQMLLDCGIADVDSALGQG